MRWLLVAIVLLLLSSPVYADILDHISLNYYPPGSIRVKYGGPYAAVKNGVTNYIRDVWEDQQYLYYESGTISLAAYHRSIQRIDDSIRDYEAGGRWWDRRWFESLPEKRGGAPTEPMLREIGHTYVIFDSWMCYITNEGTLKLKGIEATIDLAPLGDSKRFSGNGWRIQILPDVTFGATDMFSHFSDFLRTISVVLTVSDLYEFSPRINFEIEARYDFREEEASICFEIEFPLWYDSTAPP